MQNETVVVLWGPCRSRRQSKTLQTHSESGDLRPPVNAVKTQKAERTSQTVCVRLSPRPARYGTHIGQDLTLQPREREAQFAVGVRRHICRPIDFWGG